MNIYRFLVVFPAALLLTCVSFGQGNFFINVYFEGAKDYDAVYLFYNNTLQDSAIIMDKQARFLLPERGTSGEVILLITKARREDMGLSSFTMPSQTLVLL
jgi:hypothetical protein